MSRRSEALRSMHKPFIAEDRFAIERRMHPFRRSPGVGRPVSPDTLGDPLFQWFSTAVALLAAVPSVVYGLWGIFVLGPVMRVSVEPVVQDIFGFLPIFQGNPIGTDKFTAGVILAIMIIPTISAVSREALLAVPDNQREAALSLGATRWETTRVGVLRYARAGIFGATGGGGQISL